MEKHDTEFELKFLVSHHLPLKQVRKAFAGQLSAFGFVMAKKPRQKMSDIYFDNASSALQRSGWTLRCRYTKADTVCLTLKSIAAANATFRRLEHEEILPIQAIKVDRNLVVPDNSKTIQVLHENNLPGQSLLPVLKQISKRNIYTISHPTLPNTEVQWCIDRVKVKNSCDTETLRDYTEFELELLSGDERLLEHLNLIAHRCEGLSASRMSKFMRGRYTHNPESSRFEAPLPADFDKQNQHNFRTRLNDLILYEPFAYEGLHPEGVHQLRISTRKLRASLSLLHRQVPATLATRLETDLKNLTRRLGKVRDLDVHRDQLGPLLQRNELQNYRGHLNRCTHKQQTRLRQTLGNTFGDIIAELDMFCASDFRSAPDESFAEDTADKIIRRIYTAVQDINAATDAKRLHELRIELKKLRYQLTTYSVENEQVSLCLQRMKTLLAMLGKIQDTQMAQKRIDAYLPCKSKAEKRQLKSFLREQRRLAVEHGAALKNFCDEFRAPATKAS